MASGARLHISPRTRLLTSIFHFPSAVPRLGSNSPPEPLILPGCPPGRRFATNQNAVPVPPCLGGFARSTKLQILPVSAVREAPANVPPARLHLPAKGMCLAGKIPPARRELAASDPPP